MCDLSAPTSCASPVASAVLGGHRHCVGSSNWTYVDKECGAGGEQREARCHGDGRSEAGSYGRRAMQAAVGSEDGADDCDADDGRVKPGQQQAADPERFIRRLFRDG